MHLQPLIIGLLAASPAAAHRCDVHLDEQPLPKASRLKLRADAPAPPPVDLFVHVVAGSESREDGYISEAEVNAQVQIIYDLYAPIGITFNHTPSMTTWSINASWAGDNLGFTEMMTALHTGDYRTVNLYIRNFGTVDFGGSCTNPLLEAYQPSPTKRLARDGCVISARTLPNSTHPYMNQGKTAVHEIGHWFGLWHTFETQGVQDGPNPPDPCWEGNPDDDVADTPKMKKWGDGECNLLQNSCPEPEGWGPVYDPVRNFMSYSSDECMSEFTQGQKQRMYAIYDEYRKNA